MRPDEKAKPQDSAAVRLAKAERAEWLRRLSSWQTPASMSEKVEELRDLLGPEVLVQPRAGFFRDAFCAAAFARVRDAAWVRLIYPDERPDFELRFGTSIEAFEFTEADTAGRRRGTEYRLGRSEELTSFPEEEWLTPEQAYDLLRAAALRKADGRYRPDCRLLICLNPIEFGVHQAAIEAVMRDATEPAANYFAQVWTLWKGQAYRTW